MDLVNKPRVSKYVAGLYVALVVFFAGLIPMFCYAGLTTPMGDAGLIAAAVLVFVEVIMIVILSSLYRTRYVLANDHFLVKTTRLIGGSKEVSLRNIVGVEKILVPFGLRLFGASLHGGYYYVPRLGRVFLAITNFDDGVLIKTNRENYIITPVDPEEFIKSIMDRKAIQP